jgi:hypothetical protein
MNEIQEKFYKCAKIRGILDNKELMHRVYFHFAYFLEQMINYLVWDEESEDEEIKAFQKTINKGYYEKRRESFKTYVDLFLKFYRWEAKKGWGKMKHIM